MSPRAKPPADPPVEEPVVEEEVPLGEGLICPECGERLPNALRLGMHRRTKHGVASAKQERNKAQYEQRKSRGAKGAEINRMRRELKKSVSALMLLPFMAKGTSASLMNPAVTQILDEKAEAFADAWVAVAEQNDWVRQNLSRALSGGVWLNAAAQTAALGYVVAVFAQLTPLHPGALMLLPEMGQFVYQQPPPAADETTGSVTTNGGKKAEDAGGA